MIEQPLTPAPPGSLVQLGELLGGIVDAPMPSDRAVGGLRLNSTEVEAGDVFFALPGAVADGRDYISDAIARRAAAVLFEAQGATRQSGWDGGTWVFGIAGLKPLVGEIAARYYRQPSRHLRVTGITGTNGKTTVAYLLAQALEQLGARCGYTGTLGSGFIAALDEAALTTVDAIAAQARLRQFVARGATHAAMEISSHGLDQGRANGIEFDLAVFTNLSQDHLDYHATMADYARAKRKLFEFPSLRHAIINADDRFGQTLIAHCRARGIEPITFGLESGQLRPFGCDLRLSGTHIRLRHDKTELMLHSRLPGQVNVPNVLAVVGVLQAMGWEMKAIAGVLPTLQPPPGRMEPFRRDGAPTVVVDYAHTPDALARALHSLRPLCAGRLFVVFGCGGDRDRDKRPKMGRVAQQLADVCIVTDDNSRTEPPQQIAAQILGGMSHPAPIIHDRIEATRTALAQANADDVILLAGKGHERHQHIGGQVRALSDRDWVAELLAEAVG